MCLIIFIFHFQSTLNAHLTPSAGANDLQLLKRRKTTEYFCRNQSVSVFVSPWRPLLFCVQSYFVVFSRQVISFFISEQIVLSARSESGQPTRRSIIFFVFFPTGRNSLIDFETSYDNICRTDTLSLACVALSMSHVTLWLVSVISFSSSSFCVAPLSPRLVV